MTNKKELNQEELKKVAGGGGTLASDRKNPIIDLPDKETDPNLKHYIVLYTELGVRVDDLKDCKTNYLGLYATLLAAEQSGESWCKLNKKNYVCVRKINNY